ncbi:hypothetical protein KOR34_02210 [Posidoniimonas corsicana]|uniref:Uncharacterized protein n=1 Tax=Posidoniimonas corsicana TaxID=1938618 RepID=A0A5C5VAJ4_9BACT|nr:hypothetical protein [Posidoniimonas corsicana]TWT35331.1 hypothetical protein KOR34_02210 [Posidoniimonas corsicana]
MTKRRKTAPVGAARVKDAPTPEAEADPVEKVGEASDEPRTATHSGITFPLARPDDGFAPRKISTDLTRRQGAALKAILTACYLNEECEVYSARGRKPVDGYGNAVRWLLDRVADAHEQATGEKLLDNPNLVF